MLWVLIWHMCTSTSTNRQESSGPLLYSSRICNVLVQLTLKDQAKDAAARDRQKSYADLKHPLLTSSSFRESGAGFYNMFHVSNLKKCYADEPLAIPLNGLHFDDKLYFVEEAVEIIDREVKRLKRSYTNLYISFLRYTLGILKLDNIFNGFEALKRKLRVLITKGVFSTGFKPQAGVVYFFIDHFAKYCKVASDDLRDALSVIFGLSELKSISIVSNRIVEENLHIRFSENTPNAEGSRPDWLFDINALTRTMNYEPIVAGTHSNGFAGRKANDNVGQARKETKHVKDYILLPLWLADLPFSQDLKSSQDEGSKPLINDVGGKTSIELPDDPNMLALEDISIFDLLIDNEDVSAEADMNNLDTTIQVSPIPTTRIYKDHPLNQVIRDLQLATQTRNMSKNLEEYGFEEPKKVIHALKDPSWIKAMNKKDERGIVIRNKAILVAQGYIQEEGIDYDEVYAHVVIIEAIRLFLAYASFKDFVVYQMDVKSAFLYKKIEEEVYVCQPPRFEDLNFPDRVYKVEKALSGLHQAPRAWYETLSTYMLDNEFQRGKINKTLFIKRYKGELTFFLGLQVQQKKDGIFISQDKYVGEILKKFRFTEVKTTSTPMETQKPLLKDEDGKEVDVHMYRSMIGSLMYLTSSRPDIMFAVCACARYQVNPKVSLLHAVKRILQVLKSLDRKSTTGEKAKKSVRLIMEKLVIKENRQRVLVADEAVNKEIDDSLKRAATTATGLDAVAV
ncbi:putative ribonuclease H-like domain-containing protein [Tanacetum coccineum]|uniref:Ribonuclease H-like domain-containing protein n=1 Tax=Tanacetum coccineum TaxID=301880 RepID=A0ABQ5BI08_9ASTR